MLERTIMPKTGIHPAYADTHAKTPLAQRSRPGKHATPADASVESSLSMPHERDQALDMTSDANDPQVEQAARDVKQGVKDTSKAPEMDQAYKKLGR